MANFCCSIELEPRTLSPGELNQAREVAVDIIQTKESDEASRIFVEGLKPVASLKEMVLLVQEKEDMLNKGDECKDKTKNLDTSCQCSCNSAVIESPDQSNLKEPFSAPF